MKYCHVFKAAGICGIHPRHPLVSAPLALKALKVSCLRQESTNIKGRRGSDANHCQPREQFVTHVEALFLCLDHHLLFSDLELVYVCSTTTFICDAKGFQPSVHI